MRAQTTTLLAVWAALMALTFAQGWVADVGHVSRLGAAMILAIGVVAVVKARLVLRHYLGLGVAPGALAGFTVAIALILGVVVAGFLIFPTPR